MLGHHWLEVNFKSNLTEIGHIPVHQVLVRNEIVSDELMGNAAFIDVFINECVVCLTVGVNDSFGFCCYIAEVNHKVQVLSNDVGERIVVQCNLFQIRAPPFTSSIQRD